MSDTTSGDGALRHPRRRIAGTLHAELLLGFGMKAAGAGSSFVFTWLIARRFGAETVGQFQIALTTSAILSVWSGLALDNIMLRSVAPALASGRLADARASLLKALRYTALVTAIAALCVFLVALPFARQLLDAPSVAPFLQILAPAILLMGIIRVFAALLRSRGALLWSQSLDGIGYTSIALLVLLGAVLAGAGGGGQVVPVAYVIGLAVAALAGGISVWRVVRAWPRGGTAQVSLLSGLTLACVFVTAHFADWSALLIVTRNLGVTGAGIYRVSFQVCLLFAIVNTAFNAIMGPHLAAAAAADDRPRFRRVIRIAALTGLAICLPLLVVILACAEWILGLFGTEFIHGGNALRVLAVAQIVSVATGPIGTALMMLHRERWMLAIEVTATLLSIGMSLVAIPRLGMAGAAVAALTAACVRAGITLFALRSGLRRAQEI